MSETDYIINIDTTYTDANSNTLIGSNEVLSVFYYDATADGSAEDWHYNYGNLNVIPDPTFNTALSGTVSGWTYSTDGSVPPYKFPSAQYAGWNSTNELVSKSTVTSSGLSGYEPVNLSNFRSANGWRTLNNTQYVHKATFDLGAATEFNYLYLVPGFSNTTNNYLKDYRVGVSNTTADSSFVIVASGTTVSGVNLPEIVNIGGQNARYARLYADTGWGGSSYIATGKMGLFNDPDWSMFGYKEDSVVSGTYGQWEHSVSLDSFDKLYFDFRMFISNSYQNGYVKVYIDTDLKYTYDWSTINAYRDTLDSLYYSRVEEEIDVSSYTGAHTLKVKYTSDYGLYAFDFYLDNLYGQPGWFREVESSTRSIKGEFPDEVYVSSDMEGVSIIDKADNTLWMRFNVGSGYALEASARDVFADEGKIYLATSRGLVVVDFTTNKIWKYTSAGIYYRMGIKNRNQYGYWFLSDATKQLSTDDVYCVSCGTDATEGYYTVIGTSTGLSYIKGVSVVRNSSFYYLVSKVKSYGSFIEYVGGKDKRSVIGVIDNINSMSSAGFGEDVVLYSEEGSLVNDDFTNVVGDQFYTRNGNLPFSFVNGELTISGSKSNVGKSIIIQKDFTPKRNFTASVDVKIKDWPDRTNGGFYFGLTDGWPGETESYYDNDHSLMLSATNGVYGPYIENDLLNSSVYDNWYTTYGYSNADATDYQSITNNDNSVLIRSKLSAIAGSTSMQGPVVGSYTAVPSCPSFIAKIKAKITSIPTFTTANERAAVIFGVSDGSYLYSGASGAHTMGVSCYKRKGSVEASLYCLGYKTSGDYYTFDTMSSGVLFADDCTSSASYHTWELSYNSAAKSISCSVDGINVGSRTDVGFGDDVGIFFGCLGHYTGSLDYTVVNFKEFEIDYGPNSSDNKNKYSLIKYDGGVWTKPTAGGNLSGVSFWGDDGMSSAGWRTWQMTCSGITVSGSVDGHALGASQSLSTGDQPKLFLAYDMPTTTSGSNDVEIKVKNFNIVYNDSNALTGLPNNVHTVSGTVASTAYLTLYAATSSGVEQLKYLKSSPISNNPITKNIFATSSSSADYPIVYGSINNVSSIEAEDDTVGLDGLLYVGTSDLKYPKWSRIKNRPGYISATSTPSIGVLSSGTKLYAISNTSTSNDLYLYEKEESTVGSKWKRIAAGETVDTFFSSVNGRVFLNDISQDGNIYVLGPGFFDYFNHDTKKWGRSNYRTGPVYTVGAGILSGDNTTVADVKKELGLCFDAGFGKFSNSRMNWDGGQFNYDTTPDSGECAVAYSDVDDSYYLLTCADGGFYRMKNTHRKWEVLESLGETASYSFGVYMFYRPYDECVYVILKGESDAVGRKIHRYNIKSNAWELFSDNIPLILYEYMYAAYAPQEDCLYLIAGDNSGVMYKYEFEHNISSRSLVWDPADNLLPENSNTCRFRKISPTSGEFVSNDMFTTGITSSFWFDYLSTSISYTNIVEDTNGINFLANSVGGSGKYLSIRSQCCSMLATDFTATLQVKINSVPTPTAAATLNTFVFGISDHLGSPAYDTDTHFGESYSGNSGMWMMSYNSSSVSGRYSLWKRENGDDTRYQATLYRAFDATDATPTASFRMWKIVYSHSLKRLSCYIDNVLIGTEILSGRGFEHGMLFSIGCFVDGGNVSGSLDVDVKNFTITTGDSAVVSSDWMSLVDSDEYGYIGYERFDCLLNSGTNYALEAEWTINTFNIYANCYINTLGSISDGHREASLVALYNGKRRYGLYTGGDPRYITSYTGVTEYDWSTRSTFKLEKDGSNINVYVNDSSVPSVSASYSSLPRTDFKKVGFGTLNPNRNIESTVSDLGGEHAPLVSGSWTTNTDYAGASAGRRSVYSRYLLGVGGTGVSNSVSFNVNSVGSTDVFVYYPCKVSSTVDAPYTVYHSGVITLPVADAYASNSINTVYDNVNENGVVDANATTVDVNQTKIADGTAYLSSKDILQAGNKLPSGYLYLGSYVDVSKVVLTCNSAAGEVAADTVQVRYNSYMPRSKSSARVHKVSYTVGDTQIEEDKIAAFSIVDMSTCTLVDYYNTETNPSILGDDITSMDVSD